MSLVDHAQDGPLTLRRDDDLKKRYNVAASRARDQLWVVHSLNPDIDLKEGDLRRRLIKHAEDPLATQRQVQQQGNRVESEFERLALKSLSESGYRVQTQWQVGAFRIDMVVLGADSARVALECDGDRFHPPEDLDRDIDRQHILERMGWRFVRIRGSEFFRDPASAMARVRKQLAELGVEPIGASVSPNPTAEEDELRNRVVRRADDLRREWSAEESAQQDRGTEEDAVLVSMGEDIPNRNSEGSTEAGGAEIDRIILAAIREAGVPIARAEIIERSGIAPSQWLPAIRRLLQRGAVAKRGTKRGIRYVMAQVTLPDLELFSELER